MEKNETLKFYTVHEDYIDYLSQFDSHVSWNKDQKRPYVGIVLIVGNYLYFAPLYSYKIGYDKYKDNPSFIRIEDRKGKNVSIIRFAEMIPVPETAIQLLDFNSRGDKYRDLLQAESKFINDNRNVIYSKAKKIYKNVVHIKTPFFTNISCDFELLEQKLKEYVKDEPKETKYIKDIEITCEVFENISTIVKTLEDKGLKYVEEFTLNDIYMKNDKTNEFAPKNAKISDSLIIRYVNEEDQKIICKRRIYNSDGFETSTAKSILKVISIEEAEKHLNILGYTRYLNMIDKNYMYENDEFIAYIQEVKDLGTFIELEAKRIENAEQNIENLIEFIKTLNLKIGKKFDIRKADLLYSKQNMKL